MNAPAQRATLEVPGSRLQYRALLLQRAQQHIPQTAEGLPIGYYRTDLLPTTYQNSKEETQQLKNAFCDLSFEYGYPTQPDGRPFWAKLDFEPSFAYGIFQMYLEQAHEGPRDLSKLAAEPELIQQLQLQQPKEEGWSEAGISHYLYEFSILYSWRSRARAYDVYKEAAFRHQRLKRQMSVEDEDYTFATHLLGQLKEKVLSTPKFFEDMAPRTAGDLLSKLVAIRRVSVGLPAAGPLSQKETPEDTTFEMILRNLAQKASGFSSGRTFENGDTGSGHILGEVLHDPETAGQLQEIIIRVTKAQQNRLPNPHGDVRGRAFKGRGRTNELITKDDLIGPYDITGAPGENLQSAGAVDADIEGKDDAPKS
jgi:hypothetical protein